MASKSQAFAVINYRKRLKESGMVRFEVLARSADRDLIRSLARRLAQSGVDAVRIRAAVDTAISDQARDKGGILRALRRSPMVGAGVDLRRPATPGRKVEW